MTRGADGHYVLVTNVAVGARRRSGVFRSWRLGGHDEGQFLIGAFGLGAQLYDRQQASIRVAEQHADFFVRNAVVILAEERLRPCGQTSRVLRPREFPVVATTPVTL